MDDMKESLFIHPYVWYKAIKMCNGSTRLPSSLSLSNIALHNFSIHLEMREGRGSKWEKWPFMDIMDISHTLISFHLWAAMNFYGCSFFLKRFVGVDSVILSCLSYFWTLMMYNLNWYLGLKFIIKFNGQKKFEKYLNNS